MIFNKHSGPLTAAAKLMLANLGFAQNSSIFSKRVAEGVVELLELFERRQYSVLSGRLVAALFSRMARGDPPTIEFLQKVWDEIEKAAEDNPYDPEDEKLRWFHQRYPKLNWAGDLVDHIDGMCFPRPPINEKTSEEKFDGAPLHRDGDVENVGPIGVVGKTEGTIPINNVEFNLENLKKVLNQEENKMCDMTAKAKTVEIIREFCRDMEAFTSLDVSNRVKEDGLVVRHRDVAELVRQAFIDREMETYGYVREMIDVTIPSGKTAQAYLYHHSTVPADDYDNRNQMAAKPVKKDDVVFNTPIIPPLVTPPITLPVPSVPTYTPTLNAASITRGQKGDGRLEVPHKWLTRLGWNEGDTVLAVKDGDSLVLKTAARYGEQIVKQFTVDRWQRIRITTKALNEVGIHFGTGGQHIMTLRTNDIKID